MPRVETGLREDAMSPNERMWLNLEMLLGIPPTLAALLRLDVEADESLPTGFRWPSRADTVGGRSAGERLRKTKESMSGQTLGPMIVSVVATQMLHFRVQARPVLCVICGRGVVQVPSMRSEWRRAKAELTEKQCSLKTLR